MKVLFLLHFHSQNAGKYLCGKCQNRHNPVSVKVVKDDVKEVGKDRECGIKTNYDEVLAGDIIECYTLKRIDD